jgi:23S rRNA (uracil1939-C5)-methyltransferase
MNRGERVRLTIERPAAGGRMIARHEGAVVFVAGAIPGEVVDAEIEKIQRGTAWAIARDVLQRSPDRIDGAPDGACGGSVLAHIKYERQRALKSEIIVDAFRRLGRITLDQPVAVTGSPVDGYRMRARLHLRGGRIGFFREGTHSLCEPGPTRQLRADTIDALSALERSLSALERPTVSEIEVSENIDATERALHLELAPNADPSRLGTLTKIDGVTGVTCAPLDSARTMELWGSPFVTDRIAGATLTRHARSFFQGNRYLLAPLVEHVIGLIGTGELLDLYAGVGLFSVSAAVAGRAPVVAVEGDHFSADDLRRNAKGHDITINVGAVEKFLERAPAGVASVIVDPPRTGMSKEAMAGVIRLEPGRLIYVSCDIATLARDARLLLDAGYRIVSAQAFDLFPNTAHVETVIAFAR